MQAIGFHRQAKREGFNVFIIKTSLQFRWSNRAGKIIVTAGLFAQCPALIETPARMYVIAMFPMNLKAKIRIICKYGWCDEEELKNVMQG